MTQEKDLDFVIVSNWVETVFQNTWVTLTLKLSGLYIFWFLVISKQILIAPRTLRTRTKVTAPYIRHIPLGQRMVWQEYVMCYEFRYILLMMYHLQSILKAWGDWVRVSWYKMTSNVWRRCTLSGLNFTWINFRDFRVFWPISRNFVHAKFLKLKFLPKLLGKWKKLGEKQADSRNLVHAKILDLRFAKFCLRENPLKVFTLTDTNIWRHFVPVYLTQPLYGAQGW